MKIAGLNGFVAWLPVSGGKAGKGRAVTGTIQVRADGLIVKQFRFVWAQADSRLRAIHKAREFMQNNQGKNTG